MHDKLPLGHERNKSIETYDPQCQACQEERETTLHMFQCTHEDYEQWRSSFFKQLVTILDHHRINEDMKEALTDGIKSGFNDEEMDSADYAIELHYLIQSQNDIGWLNLFKGLWSKQWLTAHEEYCENMKLPHSENWTISVTHLCWTMWHSI